MKARAARDPATVLIIKLFLSWFPGVLMWLLCFAGVGETPVCTSPRRFPMIMGFIPPGVHPFLGSAAGAYLGMTMITISLLLFAGTLRGAKYAPWYAWVLLSSAAGLFTGRAILRCFVDVNL